MVCRTHIDIGWFKNLSSISYLITNDIAPIRYEIFFDFKLAKYWLWSLDKVSQYPIPPFRQNYWIYISGNFKWSTHSTAFPTSSSCLQYYNIFTHWNFQLVPIFICMEVIFMGKILCDGHTKYLLLPYNMMDIRAPFASFENLSYSY